MSVTIRKIGKDVAVFDEEKKGLYLCRNEDLLTQSADAALSWAKENVGRGSVDYFDQSTLQRVQSALSGIVLLVPDPGI